MRGDINSIKNLAQPVTTYYKMCVYQFSVIWIISIKLSDNNENNLEGNWHLFQLLIRVVDADITR